MPAGLLDKGEQQMLGRDLRVILFGRKVLRSDDGLLGLLSQFVQIHGPYSRRAVRLAVITAQFPERFEMFTFLVAEARRKLDVHASVEVPGVFGRCPRTACRIP